MSRRRAEGAARLGAAALVALALAGCSSSEGEVREVVARFESAARYRDAEGLWRLHVDSAGAGVLCDERFSRLFQKTRAERTPEGCKAARDVAALPAAEQAKLEEDVALLSQLLAFQCENTEATCTDFAHDLFLKRASSSRLLAGELEGLEVERVEVVGESEATAYVDVRFVGAQAPERIALYLARVQGRWLFKTYPW